MKKALTATALALFGLAPTVGSACEYHDASVHAANPPEQVAATPVPVAAKPSPATALKAPAAKPLSRRAVDKGKEAAPDAKVAVAAIK
jgi:hypothetical protein